MSLSLVKKSLDLFREDLEEDQNVKKKKKDPMKRIGTNRKGVKKELQRVKNHDEEIRKMRLKGKKQKSAIYDVAKKNSVDNTNKNVEYMKRLTELSAPRSSATEKIIHHHKRRKELSKEEKKEIPKSILFSDREEEKDTFWD